MWYSLCKFLDSGVFYLSEREKKSLVYTNPIGLTMETQCSPDRTIKPSWSGFVFWFLKGKLFNTRDVITPRRDKIYVEHQRKTAPFEAYITHECSFPLSKSSDTTHRLSQNIQVTKQLKLSLCGSWRGKHMYWLDFLTLSLDFRVPESRPGQPSSLPPYSFKSTSLAHPSAETMIASLIFGNSLNLSNPWFWNISAAAAGPQD